MTTSADAVDGTSSMWDGGWHRLATRLVSPNQGMRPHATTAIDLIVVHSISLPPGEFGGGAVQQLFTNQLDWDAHPYFQSIRGLQVSSHFFIDRTGGLWQFVDCDQRAWHAGPSCFQGRECCNDFSIGIELEGSDELAYTESQYERLNQLVALLLSTYPSLSADRIVGHSDIAPGRKTDPGVCFEWERVRALEG